MSLDRGSNPRPCPYQGHALPTELSRRDIRIISKLLELRKMIIRFLKAIVLFLVITFLALNSGEKSAVLAQSKNPFGLMIGTPNITLAERIALVKELGAIYFRPNSVFLDKWNGNCSECQAAISEGIGLILTIRNNGGLGQPTTPPTDYNVFKQILGEILDKYPPELLVVENEENSAALFYDGTPQEYLQELSVACEVAHSKAIKCTNGGLVSMLVTGLVANNYLEQGDPAKADEYLLRALSPEEYQQYQNMSQELKLEQLNKGKALLAGYKTSGADYVNFHWYNADTPALQEAVDYLQAMTGLVTMTNEVGQHNEEPQQVTDVMGKIVELNIPYAVWFSVASNKARALIDTNGSLRPNGEAFKTFINGMFIKGDIDKDGDVDIFDYNLMIENFGKTGCGNIADLD